MIDHGTLWGAAKSTPKQYQNHTQTQLEKELLAHATFYPFLFWLGGIFRRLFEAGPRPSTKKALFSKSLKIMVLLE